MQSSTHIFHTWLLCVVVQKFVDEDPYVQNDLVTKVDIRPYFAVFSSQLRSWHIGSWKKKSGNLVYNSVFSKLGCCV